MCVQTWGEAFTVVVANKLLLMHVCMHTQATYQDLQGAGDHAPVPSEGAYDFLPGGADAGSYDLLPGSTGDVAEPTERVLSNVSARFQPGRTGYSSGGGGGTESVGARVRVCACRSVRACPNVGRSLHSVRR